MTREMSHSAPPHPDQLETVKGKYGNLNFDCLKDDLKPVVLPFTTKQHRKNTSNTVSEGNSSLLSYHIWKK